MHESYQSVSITSFAGREKSGNHLWTHQQVNFPTSYSTFYDLIKTNFHKGDDTFTAAELAGTILLISAFSDNEGIIFVTETENLYSNLYEESTIRFHRIYRNNWFFLGRYTFWRKKLVINFTGVFLLQGKFFLYENVGKCVSGFPGFCAKKLTLPPKLHLLDHEMDRFVEQEISINYRDFDYFLVRV